MGSGGVGQTVNVYAEKEYPECNVGNRLEGCSLKAWDPYSNPDQKKKKNESLSSSSGNGEEEMDIRAI